MRTGVIIISGQSYPVKGLSVRQSLTEDQKAAEEKNIVESRMRRVALALQNADAFLPDPDNPKGQFKSSDRSTEDVVAALNADAFTDNIDDWYEAELVVSSLNRKKTVEPAKGEEVANESAGEPQATQ